VCDGIAERFLCEIDALITDLSIPAEARA